MDDSQGWWLNQSHPYTVSPAASRDRLAGVAGIRHKGHKGWTHQAQVMVLSTPTTGVQLVGLAPSNPVTWGHALLLGLADGP